VRSADGTAELPLLTWQAFASTELLNQLALVRMLAKLSTRRYHHGLLALAERAGAGPTGEQDLQLMQYLVGGQAGAAGLGPAAAT
jgi:hypothetical protein